MFLVVTLIATALCAAINPIRVEGRHFVDSITGDPFVVKGVDYQPGGSSAFGQTPDPLSDPNQCARDIFLFQRLGINTLRIYTVDPASSHDTCMTMLAAAGIYLVLDINSPRVGESLNRYEPWTTYTPAYLKHVFEVVEEFSGYNNTLGFFIGNEIVNDERSASVSPVYIRAVARDLKAYLSQHAPRDIPIGYSAADDLRYRKQLSHFLTCGPDDSAVDFYGVNSYQWCGRQTFVTSGYDALVRDHREYTVPIFLSEFGCNLVQPRLFQEVEALYSPAMTEVFSGGLAYEFTQEANEYGLVNLDSEGNAYILSDFDALERQYAKYATNPRSHLSSAPNTPVKYQSGSILDYTGVGRLKCRSEYSNLDGHVADIPGSFGTDMIRNGVRVQRGTYLDDVLENIPETDYKIWDSSGNEITEKRIVITHNFSHELSISPSIHRWTTVEPEEEALTLNETVVVKQNQAPRSSAVILLPTAAAISVAVIVFILCS